MILMYTATIDELYHNSLLRLFVERIFWLNAARALAIILVVFTHAHERSALDSDMLRSIFTA